MKQLFLLFCIISFFSCTSCKDDLTIDKNIIWKNKISGNDLIGLPGVGYPIYNNTVVFHSTPVAGDDDENSILHGLDTKTGDELWRLSNADFAPKKEIRFNSFNYYYQNKNILFIADFAYMNLNRETFFYAVDINKGKVIWVNEFKQKGYQFGRITVGKDKYAYVDFQKDTTEFSLIKVDIETGHFSEVFKFTQADIPEAIPTKKVDFSTMSKVYTDYLGNEYIALSFNGYNYDIDKFKVYMTLCVYGLTENKIVYTEYVNHKVLAKDEWDDVSGNIYYSAGRLLIGKGKTIYCYDAFKDEKGPKWEQSTVLNDGIGFGSGNDNVAAVMIFEDIGLVFCHDHLIGIDIATGKLIYNVSATGMTDMAIIDGIIYQRDGSDLQMRDPRTGKELKRVSTPPNEQAFSSSRPNGADGKIFIHSYTHAYCIKAWGK